MRLAGLPIKVGTVYDGPGNSLRTSRSATVLAMTIRRQTRFALYRETNFPAVTSAGDHRLFNDIEASEDRAEDGVGDENGDRGSPSIM